MSKGKKVLVILACLVLLANVLLLWWLLRLNAMESYEDFLPLIQRTVGTEAPLTVFGDYKSSIGDARLFLCRREDNGTLYAVSVSKGWLQYEGHELILVDRGPDIYMVHWGDGEVFMIDNPDVAYIQLSRRNPAGDTVQIPVTSVPFAYYWDWQAEPCVDKNYPVHSYECLFYNHAGEPLGD